MTAAELKAKYDALNPSDTLWSQHPEYTHQDWQDAVYEGDTLQSYWESVKNFLEDQ